MKLDALSICMILGWIFMIASWVLPLIIKNKESKSLYALLLSTFSLGIFITCAILSFLK